MIKGAFEIMIGWRAHRRLIWKTERETQLFTDWINSILAIDFGDRYTWHLNKCCVNEPRSSLVGRKLHHFALRLVFRPSFSLKTVLRITDEREVVFLPSV